MRSTKRSFLVTEKPCPDCNGSGQEEYIESKPYTVERPSRVSPYMPGKLTTKWRTVFSTRTCVWCSGTGVVHGQEPESHKEAG